MRDPELYRPRSSLQTGVQLRGRRLGTRLYTLCPPRRSAALRVLPTPRDICQDLQQPVQGSRRLDGDEKRTGSNPLAPSAQPETPTVPRQGQGTPIPHQGIRTLLTAPYLLLPDAAAPCYHTTSGRVSGRSGRRYSALRLGNDDPEAYLCQGSQGQLVR